ncbi:MAG: TRAP transporter substrate-binding protein DctP [Candidatus Sedimenticola sp. PURPLELP]
MRTLLANLLLLSALTLTFQAEAVTLKIATVVPDGTAWMKAMRSSAKTIKERTGGRVKLRFYPGGIMGNDNSVLRKIRVGQLHGGAITGGGLATIYPDARLYSMPFLFRSYAEVDHLRQRMDQVIIAGLKAKGFTSYGLSEGGFAYLMSNSPILTIEDLRAQKVWAPEGDPITRAAFEAVNVSPIALPITDVLTGLQTGLINTVGTSPIGAIALQWHTRVKYLVDVPLIYLYASLVINEKALKRVSPEDRSVLQEVLSRTFQELNRKNREESSSARNALEKQGIEFINPSLEHMDQWRNAVDRSIEKMGKQGSYSPQMRKRVLKILAEFRQSGR